MKRYTDSEHYRAAFSWCQWFIKLTEHKTLNESQRTYIDELKRQFSVLTLLKEHPEADVWRAVDNVMLLNKIYEEDVESIRFYYGID